MHGLDAPGLVRVERNPDNGAPARIRSDLDAEPLNAHGPSLHGQARLCCMLPRGILTASWCDADGQPKIGRAAVTGRGPGSVRTAPPARKAPRTGRRSTGSHAPPGRRGTP